MERYRILCTYSGTEEGIVIEWGGGGEDEHGELFLLDLYLF